MTLLLNTEHKLHTPDYPLVDRAVGITISKPMRFPENEFRQEVCTEKPCIWKGGDSMLVPVKDQVSSATMFLSQNIVSLTQKIEEIAKHEKLQKLAQKTLPIAASKNKGEAIKGFKFGLTIRTSGSLQSVYMKSHNPSLNSISSASRPLVANVEELVSDSLAAVIHQCAILRETLEKARSHQQEALTLLNEGACLKDVVSTSFYEV